MSTPPTPPTPPDQPDERPEPETPPPPPPPAAAAGPAPEAAPARRLTRSSSDRIVGGVAGGLGRYFDIDPIIFRIGFLVLGIVGGAGVLAYLAAWLLVPGDGAGGAPAAARSRLVSYLGIGLLGIACLALLDDGIFFAGPPLVGLTLIGILGVALYRAAESRGGDGNVALRRAGLGILLFAAASAGFVAVAVGAAVGGGAVIAGLVIAVGAALTVSAFAGGARWLVLPALVMAIPLGFVAAAGIDVDGGVGERDYRPTSVAELRDGYELGAGELRLDLRGVDLPAGRTPLKLDVGFGSVRVVVPEDVCVASDVRVGAGYARVLDRDSGGVDVDWRQSPEQSTTAKRLVIDAHVGLGEIQVATDPADFDDYDRHRVRVNGPGEPFGMERNTACAEVA